MTVDSCGIISTIGYLFYARLVYFHRYVFVNACPKLESSYVASKRTVQIFVVFSIVCQAINSNLIETFKRCGLRVFAFDWGSQ